MRIRFFSLLFILPCVAFSQTLPDSTNLPVNKKALRLATISATAAYGLGLAGLNVLWYKNSDRQSFRFFNDNAEWKQVDKLGHFYSSFYLSYGTSRALQHYHVKPKRADLVGAITGFAALIPIEVFDGFSDAYGASVGDIVADGAGSLFYLAQTHLWKSVRIFPKFSFHATAYASLRPEILGEGMEQIIKDYNGQTYWLSVDVDKFFRFPKWLNIAAGYGSNGMIYARDEPHAVNGYPAPYRQLYLSLDLDVTALKTRSKALKTVLFVVNMIKIPTPTLELSRKGMKFHPAYF
jgi:hypothetical protein